MGSDHPFVNDFQQLRLSWVVFRSQLTSWPSVTILGGMMDDESRKKIRSLACEAIRTSISAVASPENTARAVEALHEFHGAVGPLELLWLLDEICAIRQILQDR